MNTESRRNKGSPTVSLFCFFERVSIRWREGTEVKPGGVSVSLDEETACLDLQDRVTERKKMHSANNSRYLQNFPWVFSFITISSLMGGNFWAKGCIYLFIKGIVWWVYMSKYVSRYSFNICTTWLHLMLLSVMLNKAHASLKMCSLPKILFDLRFPNFIFILIRVSISNILEGLKLIILSCLIIRVHLGILYIHIWNIKCAMIIFSEPQTRMHHFTVWFNSCVLCGASVSWAKLKKRPQIEKRLLSSSTWMVILSCLLVCFSTWCDHTYS